MMRLIRHTVASILAILITHTLAFTNQPKTNQYQSYHRLFHQLYSYTPPSPSQPSDGISAVGVVAPLKYVGLYACLELNFPNITTGTLTFVLDTGASVSSIRRDLAETLNLPVVLRKEDLRLKGSVGGGGSFEAGDIVMLGNCTLGKYRCMFLMLYLCQMHRITLTSTPLKTRWYACRLSERNIHEKFGSSIIRSRYC